ncbi:MAG: 5-methyltetrahydropteroyltriglutamate--homocysteine S-methyltransferase [Phycisphaerae bacterium]|jgi:5-methyltetrahydropteroyltriglutamate--homocysteine methyltransferase
MLTHTLGFPRIGTQRELKRTLEGYWAGTKDLGYLQSITRDLRQEHWRLQRDAGVDLIPVGDFSLYDHVLDVTAMLGAVPARFEWKGDRVDPATYFRMARGGDNVPAMEMTKWFDTNYHYIVPELHPGQSMRLASMQLLEQTEEAMAAGFRAKPVLLGPFTYLKLSKPMVAGFSALDQLDVILPIYQQMLRALGKRVEWIQIDEPALVQDLSEKEQLVFRLAIEQLTRAAGQARILLATYFGALGANTTLACMPQVGAVHVDLARAPEQLDEVLKHLADDQALSLGIVDGRNIWRVDADMALTQIQRAVDALGIDRVMLGSSCSLLHVPIDLGTESRLDAEVRSWLAFAKQKCGELRMLADMAIGQDVGAALERNRAAWQSRRSSTRVTNPAVRERLANLSSDMFCRRSPVEKRKPVQQKRLGLPLLPTTTIGSFPQTREIRVTRRQFKANEISADQYTAAMHGFIRDCVEQQHQLGLDVLVHGEPERNDMVEYFGEQLDGFCFTSNGWVQSYGSRCVKPPIIFGDVQRPRPMTVDWIKHAQSLTDKPMKGMLTGPVTILCWSFVRDDQPRRDTCMQLALAIRDEVLDLERAGVQIIQVDEAALREGLPLRRSDWNEYLTWAVDAFRLATTGVRDETQLHTHMCYSEFNQIVGWIAKMDADVISIESSRSKMELLQAFRQFEYPNDIGPGVYDIHSPRVPSVEEIASLLSAAAQVIRPERLWVNPDCGLKTRGWPEAIASIQNMVAAARAVRHEFQKVS